MPLVFFAGGAANLFSFRRANSTRDWLAARLHRLLLPVIPLVVVWMLVPSLLRLFALPEQPINVAGGIAAQLLWFLAVYLVAVLATPFMAAAHRRWGLAVTPVMASAALLIDVARFNDVALVGYINAIFIWLAVQQVGFHYADGHLSSLSRARALAMAMTGFGITALLVLVGPYPASMVGMPGAPVSNMSPPSAVLLSLALGQIGLLLAARDPLRALYARSRPSAALRWLGPRFMTIYLWHMPALIVVSGITVLGLGYATPTPGTLLWLAAAPAWFVTVGAILIGLVRIFGRFEARPLGGATPPTRQLVAAALLGAPGCLGLAAVGFTVRASAGFFATPIPWAILVVLGLVLASREIRLSRTGHGLARDRSIVPANRV